MTAAQLLLEVYKAAATAAAAGTTSLSTAIRCMVWANRGVLALQHTTYLQCCLHLGSCMTLTCTQHHTTTAHAFGSQSSDRSCSLNNNAASHQMPSNIKSGQLHPVSIQATKYDGWPGTSRLAW
jgi:hypothetical protein